MGCDIHLYVEKRVAGVWVSADKWVEDPDLKEMCVDYHDSFYHSRCYDLFSILADVRNGYDFAGVPTGTGFIPMAKPKGLPEDCSELVANASSNYGEDGHSHSYHTLADLLAYDWTQTTKKQGWVNGVEFFKWDSWARRDGGGPDSYSGGIGGGGIKHISLPEMDALVKAIKDQHKDYNARFNAVKDTLSSLYCPVEWASPYYRQASGFLSETMPRLWRLGQPEDVRIVFWFDN